MASRRKDRRTAIDILYQADVTGETADHVLRGWEEADRPIPAFTRSIVEGVAEHQPEIDLALELKSEGWTVARMTALDRTILRVALYEMRWCEDVPDSVAISEAVETASALSSDESKRFVNGILGKLARD